MTDKEKLEYIQFICSQWLGGEITDYEAMSRIAIAVNSETKS